MVNPDELKRAWDALVKLLPSWAREKANLFLLADQELVIHQASGQEVHIKKDRCIYCGSCCLETPDGHTKFGSDEEMKCNALYKDGEGNWLCGAGPNKPFRCLSDPLKGNVPDCGIAYFKLKER